LEHILSEPASESTELTPFVYAAKMPHVGTVTPEHNTLKAFDFMPEPIDFHVGELRKQDLISLFRQRFNLPADAFNGLTEMQFQQQIFEVYLAYLKKERESVGS
jgi:hypothetical protein